MNKERLTNDDIRRAFAASGHDAHVEVVDLDGSPYNAAIQPKSGHEICDLCSSYDPVVICYLTPAIEVVLSHAFSGRRHLSEANWAACASCMTHVEAKDRRGLLDHAEFAAVQRHGRLPGIRKAIKTMHDAFWAVREG